MTFESTIEGEETFFLRLAEMPLVEVESELTLRRIILVAENIELQKYCAGRDVVSEFGVRMHGNNRQLSMINDELKRIRNVMDRTNWRNAVKAVYGQEAFEKCYLWIEQNCIAMNKDGKDRP